MTRGNRVVYPEESHYEAMIAVAVHRVDKEGLAMVVRKLAREVEPGGSAE